MKTYIIVFSQQTFKIQAILLYTRQSDAHEVLSSLNEEGWSSQK